MRKVVVGHNEDVLPFETTIEDINQIRSLNCEMF